MWRDKFVIYINMMRRILAVDRIERVSIGRASTAVRSGSGVGKECVVRHTTLVQHIVAQVHFIKTS